MKEKEFLPVIIASHNRFNLIKQLIKSIKKNSYHDVKIIVVDNSTDEEVVDYLKSLSDIIFYKWESQYPHLRLESPDSFDYPHEQAASPHWTNGWSLGKSRTMGAILAPPSKYIYFSDNDMYLTKHWDKLMIGALEKYPDLILVSGSNQHSSDESRPVSGEYNVELTGLQVGNTMMIRRNEWAQIGFFPDYDEDTWTSRELKTRFYHNTASNFGVITPKVAIHCGIKSFYTGGGVNPNKELMLTADATDIELHSKVKYPELVFE